MKIISKFKDFYDYKVAKYGIDEKLIYIRKTYCEYFQVLIGNIKNINIDYRISEDNFNKNLKDDTKAIDERNIHKILFIGEKLVHLFFTENKDGKKFNIYSRFREDWEYLLSYNRKKLINLNIDKDDIILNEPLILIELIGKSKNNRYLYTYKFTYNPYLSKLGIYIDEDFIWQSLVEFLSNKRSEKEITPEVSNENKILSKGFDLKTSFRPNMKKKNN